MTPLADLARDLFAAAVAAVSPESLVRRLAFSPAGVAFGADEQYPAGKLVLTALGKAAPGLAAAFLRSSPRPPDRVFVLAPDSVEVPGSVAPHTRVASHPLPDARGEAATAELLGLLAGLAPEDGVVLLLSGGASSLLALPLPGIERAAVGALSASLMAGGASIRELNTVRKHLLAATGGRLAAACPAPILTLAVSDVPGDDLATIASGPTVADATTFADAAAVLARHGLAGSFPEVAAFLAAAGEGKSSDSPKPGDPRLAKGCARLLGTSRDALQAAAAAARRAGLTARVLSRRLHGEARAVGEALAGLARALAPGEATALLFAGETTVRVHGDGCGGRNLELALAAACALRGTTERCLLAAGTDGVDGGSPAAGAVVDGGTIGRGAARGRDPLAALDRNDSWGFFAGLPDALVTGPTGTNVADVVFVLAGGGEPRFLSELAAQRLELPALPGAAPPG